MRSGDENPPQHTNPSASEGMHVLFHADAATIDGCALPSSQYSVTAYRFSLQIAGGGGDNGTTGTPRVASSLENSDQLSTCFGTCSPLMCFCQRPLKSSSNRSTDRRDDS